VPVRTAAPGDAGAASAALARLAADYWREYLTFEPIEATLLGYPGYDDLMPDESPAARAAHREKLVEFRARLENEVPASGLADADRVTRGVLSEQLAADVSVLDCALDDWSVDPRNGPQAAYLDLAGLQSVKTPADGATMLGRWRAMPRAIDQQTANLLRGLGAGKVSARSEVARVVRQLDELLARPDSTWPLAAPPTRIAAGTWPEVERTRFAAALERAVTDGIRPAFTRYRDAIRDRILPAARGDEAVGIRNLPGGDACYRALARVHTSLAVDPQEVHRVGLAELRRIRAEMEALGPAAIGTADFAAIRRRLRGEARDKAMFFTSREDVEATAREALARASAAQSRFLGRLPRTPCQVKRIEEHEERDAPIAYYRQPAVDGSRPGAYYVNTYDPTSRPRFEAESLAFHEAVPGHHVQIALAQEMTGVPEFRKQLGVTAFVEGWGLYSERLAEELGLYSSPLGRIGRLNLEAWRAARLVVDTGIHALGWSRARAVAFLTDNTAVAANNIQNEVDRYIGWPGQALAYKLGELEIVRLRRAAEARLGKAFDLRAFHDVVLGRGAVTLAVLREEVERWASTVTPLAAR
jgi:uncharacterized protein (DUF885 family)